MLTAAIVLAIVLLLVLLLLFTPTLVGVDYLQNDKKQKLKIRLRLLGISFFIPILPDKEKKEKKKTENENKPKLTPKRFIAFSKQLYAAYREIQEDFNALLSEVKKRFSCREVHFAVEYGTNNPAATGILNGAVWTASTLLLKLLDSMLGVEKKHLEVHPVFTKPCMSVHFKCTFCFKLIDALRFALKIRQLVKIIKSRIGEVTETAEESIS